MSRSPEQFQEALTRSQHTEAALRKILEKQVLVEAVEVYLSIE